MLNYSTNKIINRLNPTKFFNPYLAIRRPGSLTFLRVPTMSSNISNVVFLVYGCYITTPPACDFVSWTILGERIGVTSTTGCETMRCGGASFAFDIALVSLPTIPIPTNKHTVVVNMKSYLLLNLRLPICRLNDIISLHSVRLILQFQTKLV